MISDVLSDARHDIAEYLKNPATNTCYQRDDIRQMIERVLIEMAALQLKLDQHPQTR